MLISWNWLTGAHPLIDQLGTAINSSWESKCSSTEATSDYILDVHIIRVDLTEYRFLQFKAIRLYRQFHNKQYFYIEKR